MEFEIDDDVALPKVTRGPPSTSKFRFDDLQVWQSIHIPATATIPKPAKSYGSLVWNATASRTPKHFVVRRVGVEDKRGPGARIFRLADLTPEDIARREANSAALASARAKKLSMLSPTEIQARKDAATLKRAATLDTRKAAAAS